MSDSSTFFKFKFKETTLTLINPNQKLLSLSKIEISKKNIERNKIIF